MNLVKNLLMLLGIASLILVIDGLRKKGPAEKVGEQLDEAGRQVGRDLRHAGRSLHQPS